MTKAEYNRFERRIAAALASAPAIKAAVKKCYQVGSYLAIGYGRYSRLEVLPKVELAELFPREFSEALRKQDEVFFGYYDKSPWSPCERYVAGHVRSNGRSSARVVAVDLTTSEVVHDEETSAWNHQQGAMTQWIEHGGELALIYNEIRGGVLGARIVSMDGTESFIDWPIQSVHPKEEKALSLNYKRLYKIRPEYGYVPDVTNFSADQPLDSDGVWEVNLSTGNGNLVIPLSQLVSYKPSPDMEDAQHKVNHILYSPDGTKYIFMHRWIGADGKRTRLFLGGESGLEKLLLDEQVISHCTWVGSERVIAWAVSAEFGPGYHDVDLRSGEVSLIGHGLREYGDGHPSMSPDNRWMVTDNYPNRVRQQSLLLYALENNELIRLGSFHSPLKYFGAERCDLHPRWSPTGTKISFDSTFEGVRRSYVVDLSEILHK